MLKLVLAAIAALVCTAANAASPLESLVDKGRASAFYGSAGAGSSGAMLDVLKRSQLAERMATLVNASLPAPRPASRGSNRAVRRTRFSLRSAARSSSARNSLRWQGSWRPVTVR